jgi:CheY-like chemotaxis protein
MKTKILIADDEPSVRRLLSRLARSLEYEVHIASDGMEAIAMAEEKQPDIVLMDMHMPQMDGLEALREIHGLLPKAKILVITGDRGDSRARAAMESGAADYILKPFELDDVRQALELQMALAPWSA